NRTAPTCKRPLSDYTARVETLLATSFAGTLCSTRTEQRERQTNRSYFSTKSASSRTDNKTPPPDRTTPAALVHPSHAREYHLDQSLPPKRSMSACPPRLYKCHLMRRLLDPESPVPPATSRR